MIEMRVNIEMTRTNDKQETTRGTTNDKNGKTTNEDTA
jgi:hypothetical protein